MKKNYTSHLLTVIFLVCTGSAFGQEFKKLDKSEVDTERTQIAIDFGNQFMEGLQTGSYHVFTNDAIDQLKSAMTPAAQEATYQQLKDQFGEFVKAEYVETWQKTGDQKILMIRMRAYFSNSSRQLEFRIVLDDSNKIAGIWFIPWKDNLG